MIINIIIFGDSTQSIKPTVQFTLNGKAIHLPLGSVDVEWFEDPPDHLLCLYIGMCVCIWASTLRFQKHLNLDEFEQCLFQKC